MDRYRSVLVEAHEGVARVKLNRPDRRNALDGRMIDEVHRHFEKLAADETVRVVVLTGSGEAFCSGVDLQWLSHNQPVSEARARTDAERLMRMYEAVDRCACPVIALVQGAAYGGGVGLLASCDVAVAAQGATFALSEATLGLVPAVIAPALLRKAGESFVRRYSLTAERFSAEVAKHYHLVHDLAAGQDLERRVDELAAAVVRLAQEATRQTKRLMHQLGALSNPDQREACIEANVCARLSPEAVEGLKAFFDRRPPRWTSQRRESSHALRR